jgi:glucokinase
VSIDQTRRGPWAIGIDVGGTKCSAVVVTLDQPHIVVAQLRTASRAGSQLADALDLVVQQLQRAVADRLHRDDFVGVAMGVAGLVTNTGVIRASPNLGDIDELALGIEMERRGYPSWWVGNDNTAATLAEWLLGAGRGLSEMVYVGLGTGIGGGAVVNGALHVGASGFAGEFGHMVVEPNGVTCVCGRIGCWERYASGAGLAWCARHRGLEVSRGEEVIDAVRRGDELALAVVDDFARWVALGVANLVNVYDPQLVVLGGGVLDSADVVLAPIQTWMHRMLYAPDHRTIPNVVAATFGSQAGAIGAALAILRGTAQ